MRMLGTNHPQQPPHPGLLQISALTPKHRLRTPSQYKQPRRLTRHLRQLTNNTHQMPHTLDTHRVVTRGPGHHDHTGELVVTQLIT
ncbi:hypothetical protein MYBA111488_00605 [Mycobacterium basiliense]